MLIWPSPFLKIGTLTDLLLDTCGLIWLSQGGGKLSKKTLSLIDEANFVYVSSISAWEIGFLHAKNRISLPLEPQKWFEVLCEQQNIVPIHISPEIGFKANALPWHHKDPSDRLIIATAMLKHLAIVTQDQFFPSYDVVTLGWVSETQSAFSRSVWMLNFKSPYFFGFALAW